MAMRVREPVMEVRNLTADAETFTSNVYLVDDRALVDVGTVPDIVSSIDGIDAVVLTHQHGDHVAVLDDIVDAFDPEVYAFDPHPARTQAIEDGDEIEIGQHTYEVVYTPGHASDHVAFLSEETIFSGDVVVYEDGAFSGGSFGRTDQPGQSRERLIESINTILERMGPHVSRMYPGHGPDFEGEVRETVERALERASRRELKYPED